MQGPQAVEWEETKMRSHSPQLSVVHLWTQVREEVLLECINVRSFVHWNESIALHEEGLGRLLAGVC
jgi:hypothetical protein